MKTILTKILLITFSTSLLFSCSKEPSHSIRVNNSFSIAMSVVKINSTNYGQIAAGSTSDYKPVNEGSFSVSGTSVSGQTLTGSGNVTGRGNHKWTLTITAAGGVSIAEDK